MPMEAIESPLLPASDVVEAGTKVQKAKTLPCQYCQKRFRRLEHVQRHERTHTKEKPFRCDCGKRFGRRDLLVRHDKLVHSNENSKHHKHIKPLMSPTSTVNTSGSKDPDMLHTTQSSRVMVPSIESVSTPGPMLHHRPPGCNLDLLSDDANHLASGNDPLLQQRAMLTPLGQGVTRDGLPMDGQFGSSMIDEDTSMKNSGFAHIDTPGPVDDYNFFLDDVDLTSHSLPSAFDTEYPPPFWSKATDSDAGAPSGHTYLGGPLNQHLFLSNSVSRFGSRLPSLQPESEPAQGKTSNPDELPKGPVWKISPQDYQRIQIKVEGFSHVLNSGFVLPSRHTLSRFLEGYINRFHEHLPFLHMPTFSAVNLAPEILLTLAAVGAQYRFESHRSNRIWYAARDIALEQLRRRSSHGTQEVITPSSTYRPDYNSRSPNGDSQFESSRGLDDMSEKDICESPETDSDLQARLDTVMALLLLMAMGTWGPRILLREALSLQSVIALLVREDGLGMDDEDSENISFEDWIRIETRKRTKLIVYCFFNLHCIAYNMPPLILNSEVRLRLPHSATLWKAETAGQWMELRRTAGGADVPFQEAFTRLFSSPATPGKTLSSLGNYCLIHGLIQHIFFVRQTSTDGQGSLKVSDIDNLGQALRVWQAGWEEVPDSSLDPLSPYGPVAFNSTALLRLAYIRLQSDLGPCRRLDVRDPIRIAWAFKSSPPLVRSPRLGRAVLQAASALAIPVRMGINFVAKTQTFSWSIQHALCNLECAFLLSKWLETIAMSTQDDPLTAEEKNMLDMVRSMLNETEFALLNEDNDRMGVNDESIKIKQIGAAVVRLWAETFRGVHVFQFVKLIGSSLDYYADLLEKAIAFPEG